jgi:uncharacterized protein
MTVLLLRLRFLILAGLVVLLIVLSAIGPRVSYDQSIESFFAPNDPTVLAYRESSSWFGNDQLVFISYDDSSIISPEGIGRVAELASDLREPPIEGVVEIESLDQMPLFWRLDDALLALEKLPKLLRPRIVELIKTGLGGEGRGQWATPTIGAAIRHADDVEIAAIRARVVTHPLLSGTVISSDGKSTALVARLKSAGEHDAKQTIAEIRSRADGFAERHGLPTPMVVGPPVLLADGFEAIEVDGKRLATIGMLLISVVMFTATRSIWWAVVPILAGWTTWRATEAILSLLGLQLSLSGGPLVAQIIVLTMPAASHLALHFRDDRRRMAEVREAAIETFRTVSRPIIWCTLAATIGYGALVSSNVVPIRQFGAVLAIATAAASILTVALSASAMMPLFRLDLPVRFGSTSRTGEAMRGMLAWINQHPLPILVTTLAIALPISGGMWWLTYESNYINAFKPTTRVVRDYFAIEERLGGIGLVGLIVPIGDEIDGPTLGRLHELDDAVRALKTSGGKPAASQVLSLATVLDPDRRLAAMSAERREWFIATKVDLIRASAQSDLLRSFWSPKAGRARTLVRLSEQQLATAKEAIFSAALLEAEARFGSSAELTGLSKLLTETTRGVVATQWTTFSWATLGILLVLAFAFRSVGMAALAILPTLLAVGLVLGLMGWFGLKLDIATALVASVALGLSVDDTFHCLLNFRRLRRSESFREALLDAYAVSGPGVLLSSLAVALGFAVLRLSVFVPFSTFGLMVCIATAGSSLGNLVLLPACLSLAERVERTGSPRNGEP